MVLNRSFPKSGLAASASKPRNKDHRAIPFTLVQSGKLRAGSLIASEPGPLRRIRSRSAYCISRRAPYAHTTGCEQHGVDAVEHASMASCSSAIEKTRGFQQTACSKASSALLPAASVVPYDRVAMNRSFRQIP
jgi:hypothetical protein